MGLQFTFCHSAVDNFFAPGIEKRLNGWVNQGLNVGRIASLAPNFKPFSDLLGVDVATKKKVLHCRGPGRFDRELGKDGKALPPDGKQAGTLLAPTFGLAAVNLHIWTGFGSVPSWNASCRGNREHGSGRSSIASMACLPTGSASTREPSRISSDPNSRRLD
jgi:hypothetical protein